MVQCLHELSSCFPPMFVVVMVISSFICCRAIEVGSLDLRSSRALILSNISAGTGSLLIRCRPEGIWCDAAFRMMVRKIFSPFWLLVGSRLLLSLLIVGSIRKQMRIGRWSEPRFVFVCQLVEVIREADANETSGKDGLALLGSLVGESQLRTPKFEPEIMLSNMLSLVSVELEYHDDWCALKSPSIRVSVVVIRWSREER